jgi:metal-sulfur cluster biosynthetic enzyme
VINKAKEQAMAETATVTQEDVVEALRDVYDPEIPVNIVDLGLVYDIKVDDGDIEIQMTLTFAGCGMGPYIAQQAEWRLAELDGAEDINVDLVYDPPWTPDMITEEGKKALGMD